MRVTFPDKHTIQGRSAEHILGLYAVINGLYLGPEDLSLADMGRSLLSERTTLLGYDPVDATLPYQPFLEAVAATGMIDLDLNDTGLEDKG